MLTVYHHPNCSSCKKAIRWLADAGVAHTLVDIRDTPPDAATLAAANADLGGNVKKLFNTSGQSYRGGGWKDRLPNMSDAEAIAALADDGMLIKRPLAVGERFAAGFKEAEWAERFAPSAAR